MPYTFPIFAVLLALLVSALPSHVSASTASGIDTLGTSQIFAVQGNKVGEWTNDQLSVTGAIQVGQTTVNCGPNNAGAQRFNAANRQIEFCDGIGPGWTQMGGERPGTWCGYYYRSQSDSPWATGYEDTGVVTKFECYGSTTHNDSYNSGGIPHNVAIHTVVLDSCPAGYELQQLTTSGSSTKIPNNCHQSTCDYVTVNTSYATYTCKKNN